MGWVMFGRFIYWQGLEQVPEVVHPTQLPPNLIILP